LNRKQFIDVTLSDGFCSGHCPSGPKEEGGRVVTAAPVGGDRVVVVVLVVVVATTHRV
jgi:hypothetical protein